MSLFQWCTNYQGQDIPDRFYLYFIYRSRQSFDCLEKFQSIKKGHPQDVFFIVFFLMLDQLVQQLTPIQLPLQDR